MLSSIQDIQHCVYINLDSRPDRRQHVLQQLQLIGIQTSGEFNKCMRFPAIPFNPGNIGCTMSHLAVLKMARARNWPHVLIVEDDIEFTNPGLFIKQCNLFFKSERPFDVVLFAGNNVGPFTHMDPSCVQIQKCATTTGYLAARHYYDALIENVEIGLQYLTAAPNKHAFFAIDTYWFRLQERDRWFLIVPLTVTQKEGYSDIEKRYTMYRELLLTLDKTALFAKR
jgi:glycosyl transferase family 25